MGSRHTDYTVVGCLLLLLLYTIAIAAHSVRLFQSWCQRRKCSSFYIFIDIKEAFYKVIRQHAIDATFQDEHVLQFLKRMDIHDLHIEDVARLLEGANALESTGCPTHLRQMISEVHRDTFFILEGDNQPIRTERGTRPGDGFADVLWSLVFSKWIKDVEATLHAEDILKTHLVEWIQWYEANMPEVTTSEWLDPQTAGIPSLKLTFFCT